jgi:hypothetical protein
VWSTVPRADAVYDEGLRSGWLTFESADTRKRLVPIPRGWEDATPERLDLMCRAAEVVRLRRGKSLTPDPDAPPEARGSGRRPDAPDAPESK